MRKHGIFVRSLLCSAVALSTCSGNSPALADGLLDSTLKYALANDFMSYFGFTETKSANGTAGLIDHFYYSKTWTSSLILSVNKSMRVVHMKLGVPRPLLDDEKVCTRGRDIVKSFVLASAVGPDIDALKGLADEIYVRGLDLQPINLNPGAAADSKKPLPRMQAYKIGKGPLANGDDAIFLPEMPRLSPRASDLFEAVAGKKSNAGQIYQNCRIAFMNEDLPAARSAIKLLWCDAWDEAYLKANMASAQK